jgi:hypothetical protein
MSAIEAQFFAGGMVHATNLHDQLQAAKAEHRGQLNYAAYRQGMDGQYLGINGRNYYGKPWGNDSSNIQAVLNGPAYWKRVYYRENVAARFAREDEARERMEAGPAASSMRKSVSDSALQKLPAEAEDSYGHIKESMKPFVLRQGKPRIKAPEVGERLNFFNTLHNKYHMKAGGKNLAWNVDKQTHRSSKSEREWVLSNYFRTDTQAVLAGAGSEANVRSSSGGVGAATS